MQTWANIYRWYRAVIKTIYKYQGGYYLDTNNLKIWIQYKYQNFTIIISTKEFEYSSDTEACPLSNTHKCMHTHIWHTEVGTKRSII